MKKAGGKSNKVPIQRKQADPPKSIPIKAGQISITATPPPLPPIQSLKNAELEEIPQVLEAANPGRSILSDWVTADALIDGKKMLSQKSRSTKQVTLDRHHLFDKHETHEYYPLEMLKDAFTVHQGNTTTINLTGLEQLTDMFFIFVHYLHSDALFRGYLKTIVLTGAAHITDLGIHYMVETFPNLEKVLLNGCTKVTNDGYAEIMTKLQRLQSVSIGGCDISIVVPIDEDRLNVATVMLACPIISPPAPKFGERMEAFAKSPVMCDINKLDNLNIHKVVIVTSRQVRCHLSNILAGKESFSQARVVTLSGWKSHNGGIYNIIECPLPLCHVFATTRTLFMVPFNLDKDVNSSLQDVLEIVLAILLQQPAAVIGLVGVTSTGSPMCAVTDMLPLVISALSDDLSRVLKKSISALQTHVYVDAQPIDLPYQLVTANLWRLRDSLNDNLSDRIQVCSVDVTKKEEATLLLNKCLQDCAVQLNKQYPGYQKIATETVAVMSSVTKEAILQDQTQLATKIRNTGTNKNEFGSLLGSYRKLLDLMTILGMAVTMKVNGQVYVTTDVDWLGRVYSSLLHASECSNPQSMETYMEHPEVHPNTVLVSRKQIIEECGPVLKPGSSDAEVMETMTMLISAGHLGFMSSQSLVLTTNLLDEPPAKMGPFLEIPGGYLKVTYNLAMPLPESAVGMIVSLVQREAPLLMVTRKTVLVQQSPLKVIIQFAQGKFGQLTGIRSVTLTSAVVFQVDDPDTTSNEIQKMLNDLLCRFLVLLETVFRCYHIAFTYEEGSHTIKGDSNYTLIYKPDPASTIAANHSLTLSKTEDALMCSNCGEKSAYIQQFWDMHKELRPGLCSALKGVDGSILQQKGNWFNISPSLKGYGFTWSQLLNVSNFSSLRFMMLNKSTDASIFVSIASDTFALQRAKHEDTVHLEINEKKVGEVHGVLDEWKMLQLRVKYRCTGSDTPAPPSPSKTNSTKSLKKALLSVEFSSGGEVFWTADKQEEVNLAGQAPTAIFRVFSTQQMNFLLYPNLASSSSIPSTWMVGMRLEALDRKNPSLICVATIMSVSDDQSTVGIHFDGWTSRYDYEAEVTSEDLHPVGWVAHVRPKGKDPSLQSPHGYRRKFTWAQYLEEENTCPVPPHLFTERQSNGTPPFPFDYIRYAAVQASAFSVASCKFRTSVSVQHYQIYQPVAKEKLRESFRNYVDVNAPAVVSLPPLTRDSLRYPCMTDLRTYVQALHVLCPNNGYFHLMDMEAFKNDHFIEELNNSCAEGNAFCLLNLVFQKHFLPSQVKCLVKDCGDLSSETLHDWFRNYFSTIFMVFINRVGATNSEDIYKKICTSVVDSGFRAHNLGEHMKKMDDCVLCSAHALAHAGTENGDFSLKDLRLHYNLMTELDLSKRQVDELPADIFSLMINLKKLNVSQNKIHLLPSLQGASMLRELNIGRNFLSSLPGDFATGAPELTELVIAGNPFSGIPVEVLACTKLQKLDAAGVGVTELPAALAKLTSLQHLNLSGHALSGSLPAFLGDLQELQTLDLSGVPWFSEHDSARAVLSRAAFDEVMNSNALTAALSEKERSALFDGEEGGQETTLDHKGITRLNTSLYQAFPRLGQNGSTETKADDGDKDNQEGSADPTLLPVFSLVKLKTLRLHYLNIREIPPAVSQLTELQTLDLSHCPALETVSSEVATCKKLQALPLRDCANLKTPPKEIIRRGFQATLGYLRRLQLGSVTCKRTKIMMVGLGGAGKTSTIKALMANSGRYDGDLFVTDGIDIMTWKVCYDRSTKEDNTITYSVWDFAGQTVYYNTHQFFLSNRAIYLLMWNVRLGHEHAGLDFWLSSIACHAPKAPILVVGTHIDQVEKFWLPQEAMQRRFPQICGFHSVSSYSGEGINELGREIYNVALKEKYMGEKIPQAWLALETAIQKKKTEDKSNDLLELDEVRKIAESAGIIDDLELRQATRFLHDLGSLQHFESEFLRNKVVINPQWIVDVMSCVVSVHENAIKDGKILHSDLENIWAGYDKELHPWLLRLTEEFDLTFPLHDEPANLVACLLPDREPEFTWQDVSDIPGQHETKMIYKFDYLPAGLFNRAQVRLSQFSDSCIIWKKGSLLHKSGHRALMSQPKDGTVEVKVQGACPENFLFLVHEVFETLIFEAYNGVSYDFLVPCTDCIKVGTYDPCMFEASKIRRASELKVPFLQCDKYFHTLSMSEIQTVMPPDNSADFDAHLERNLRDLKDLRSDMEVDVFMFYCAKDVPGIGEEDKKVAPRQIYQDLVDDGFKVWFTPDPDSVNLKSMALTVKNAKLVLILVSDNFVQDDHCCNVFYYAQHTTHKRIQVIVLGGNQWQKTDIGMQIASEVYVKMDQVKRYIHKKVELLEAVRSKTNLKKTVHPRCFISYCWSNSSEAIAKGSRRVEGALGWGDPRQFKKMLEEKGITCWMDIERVGQGGLFEDIAEGLRHAKVVVACVSDEYAKSKNCQMELRFATSILKLPVVVVIVGTGFTWEAQEVGMLTLGSPKINGQFESPSFMERLLTAVKAALPQEETSAAEEENKKDDSQEKAYRELLELAQRKFLRQVSSYVKGSNIIPTPRLFFLDFVSKNDKDADWQPLSPEWNLTEDFDSDRFIIRILCEHEQGWHVPASGIPVPETTSKQADFIATFAPFGARIMAILRHTNLDYPCLTKEKGEELRIKFEENCSLEKDFKEEYNQCRQMVLDIAETCNITDNIGGVKACHMPNGKVLWLCEEHRKNDRISTMTDPTDLVDTEAPAASSIKLTASQDPSKIKARGKLVGAAAAAQIAGNLKKMKTTSQACSVM